MSLGLVLLLAFVLRLGAVVWLPHTVPYSDYLYYHEAGRLTAEDWGLWLDAERIRELTKLSWWPPGYPFFLGLVYEIAGPDHRAVVFLQVLIGTVVCALVLAIGQRAYDRRVGLASALLVAVNPTYIFTTNLIASENLFALWLSISIWLALRPWRGRREPFLLGVVLALAALTRGVALLLLPLGLLWIRTRTRAADEPVATRLAWRPQAAWLLAGFLLLIAPWSVRNALVVGPALVSHGGGVNFYFGHNEGPVGYRPIAETPMAGLRSVAEIDRRGWELGLRHIARDPLGFVRRGAVKVRELFASPAYALNANTAIQREGGGVRLLGAQTAPADRNAAIAAARRKATALRGVWTDRAHSYARLLQILALIALVLWRRLTPALRFIAWLSIGWVAAHVLFWAQPRFRYPLEIPLALLASFTLVYGFAALHARIRAARRDA
ncbi:MAG: glycosyltransferase family 39 protein [Candidatus Latescibacterota bacterium]|nr:MAG: glycosyltransferase family 39 protein [Candidatus Latescibacterota bacterium]